MKALARLAIAAVWLYQGGWCKLVAPNERHLQVVADVPGVGPAHARRGKPRLLFGQMYEDWDIEAEVLPPAGRVFCIASAGSTSIALAARGLSVTTVDINPAQVDYVRARLGGAAARAGTADRFFA